MAASSFISKLLLRRPPLSQPGAPNLSSQGVTLVECIVAIAAIALASAMIAPPLFIAAATRLQNQRAEQALQLAQGEVDRIRFLVNRQKHTAANLPVNSNTAVFASTPAPTGVAPYVKTENPSACQSPASPYANQQYTPALALQVDITGDCKGDFIVQEFRTLGRTTQSEINTNLVAADRRPSSFCFMVRVYGAAAADYLQQGGALSINPASLQFTNGEGNQKTQPLAVLTTPVIWSDRDFSSSEARAGIICPSS